MYTPDRPFVTIITAIKGLWLSPFNAGIRRRSPPWAAAKFLVAMQPAVQVAVTTNRNRSDAKKGCYG
jgi:hypothetical protein